MHVINLCYTMCRFLFLPSTLKMYSDYIGFCVGSKTKLKINDDLIKVCISKSTFPIDT